MRAVNVFRFILLLLLLAPIGFGAAWGVLHARPDFALLKSVSKNGNRYILGKHYLKNHSALTCLNTATGEYQSVLLPRRNESYRGSSIGFDGNHFWNLESNDQGQHQLCVVNVPDLSIVSMSTIEDASDHPEVCVADECIVRIQSDSVTVESIGTRTQTDSMPLGFSVEGLLEPVQGTSNVLVYERAKPLGAASNFLLLKIDSGKLHPIASWQALDHRVMELNSPQTIVSLLPDGVTIESIDAIDGHAYYTKSIPDNFGLRLPLGSLEGDLSLNWNHFRTRDSGGMNLTTGVAIKVPDGFQGIWHDVDRKRLLCRRPFGYHDREYEVLDLQTGLVLFRIPLDSPQNYGDELRIEEDQLVIASRDSRIFFYDLKSGMQLRTIDPFQTIHWLNCICGFAFLAWCVLWSNFSNRTHLTGLIDLVVYTAIPLAYCIFVYLQTGVQGRSDPTIVSFGVTLGLSMLASLWCAIGRARWSMSILPTILCVLASLAIHSFTIGKAGIYAPMVIQAIVCTTMSASLFILLLRSSSIQFFQNTLASGESLPTTISPKTNVFPLRDLFLWTACFGIFFAMLKNDLCILWMDWSILVIALPLGFFFAFLAAVAAYFALCCNDVIAVRVAQLSCGITMLCVIFADPAGGRLLPRNVVALAENLSFIPFLIPVWLTVYLGLYAFRLRGWRITSLSWRAGTRVCY